MPIYSSVATTSEKYCFTPSASFFVDIPVAPLQAITSAATGTIRYYKEDNTLLGTLSSFVSGSLGTGSVSYFSGLAGAVASGTAPAAVGKYYVIGDIGTTGSIYEATPKIGFEVSTALTPPVISAQTFTPTSITTAQASSFTMAATGMGSSDEAWVEINSGSVILLTKRMNTADYATFTASITGSSLGVGTGFGVKFFAKNGDGADEESAANTLTVTRLAPTNYLNTLLSSVETVLSTEFAGYNIYRMGRSKRQPLTVPSIMIEVETLSTDNKYIGNERMVSIPLTIVVSVQEGKVEGGLSGEALMNSVFERLQTALETNDSWGGLDIVNFNFAGTMHQIDGENLQIYELQSRMVIDVKITD